MKLRIIDGCVEIKGKIFNIGDVIECDTTRGNTLINKGYCIEITNQTQYNQPKATKDETITQTNTELEQEASIDELFE